MDVLRLLMGGLALIFTVAILYRLWEIIDFYQRRAAGPGWLIANAQVTARYVETLTGHKVGTSYRPKITFSYQAGGLQYEKNISLGMTASESSAREAIRQINDTIEVRYQPNRPARQITAYEQVSPLDMRDMVLLLLFLGLWLFLTFDLGHG